MSVDRIWIVVECSNVGGLDLDVTGFSNSGSIGFGCECD